MDQIREVLVMACDNCEQADALRVGLDTADYQTLFILCERCHGLVATFKLEKAIEQAMLVDKKLSREH